MTITDNSKIKDCTSKLKKVRLLRGYTQEMLSELSEVNIKSITSYEQNPKKLTNASVGTIYKLADALGCDIEDLLNKESIR